MHHLHLIPPWCVLSSARIAHILTLSQGKAKKTRKFAQVKRLLNPNDIRLYVTLSFAASTLLLSGWHRKENKAKQAKKEEEVKEKQVRRVSVSP